MLCRCMGASMTAQFSLKTKYPLLRVTANVCKKGKSLCKRVREPRERWRDGRGNELRASNLSLQNPVDAAQN